MEKSNKKIPNTENDITNIEKLNEAYSKYIEVRPFSEGLAAVSQVNKITNTKKWGFLNKNGEEVLLCKYNSVNDFLNGESEVTYEGDYFEKQTFNINREGNRKFQINDNDLFLPYDLIYFFNDFCRRVSSQGKMGLIDINGHELLSCIYDEIDSLNDGFALIKCNPFIIGYIKSTCGLINEYGKTIIPCNFYSIKKISDRYYLTESTKKYTENGPYWSSSSFGIFDVKNQTEVVPCKFSSVMPFQNGLSEVMLKGCKGFINIDGLFVFKRDGMESYVTYDFVFPRKDMYFTCYKNGKQGVIDKDEKIIIPCNYYEVKEFKNELAIIVSHFDHTENYVDDKWIYKDIFKYGLIDTHGIEITPCKYDELEQFSYNLARFKKNNKYGFIDQSGKEVIDSHYDFVTIFENNVAIAEHQNKYFLIDVKENILSKYSYDEIKILEDGIFRIKIHSKYGLMNIYGEELLNPICDNISYKSENGTILVKTGHEKYIINLKLEVIIPIGYEVLSNFSEGLAVFGRKIKNNDILFGYVNMKNEIVIPAIYDSADDFYNGKANVINYLIKENGFQSNNYIIDYNGKIIDKKIIVKDEVTHFDFNNEGGCNIEEDIVDINSVNDNPYYDENLDLDQQSLDFWDY